MRGEIVIVRTFGDRLAIRRVWAVDGEVVLITNDEIFQRLLKDDPAAMPIGFKRTDVFQFDAEYAGRDVVDWTELTPWKPEKATA